MPHALQDISTYQDEMTCTSSEAFAKYGLLVNEYLRLASGSRKCAVADDSRFRYVIANGIRTLTHVFRILLLYTRNLDATWYHCQKAAYYYVEFMGQIGADANGFLQLNAKDAALFVYKKSIFEINGERRKEFGSVVGQDDRLDNIDTLTGVFGRSISEAIGAVPPEAPRGEIADLVHEAVQPLSRALLNLALVGSEEKYRERLDAVAWFDQATGAWGAARTPVLELFVRKIRSYSPTLDRLEARSRSAQHNETTACADPGTYVSWLLGRRRGAR
tara:strand:+ start:706 stop:1530 length:825 start_codon:yes stop_codon:yes gene_type:complete